MVFELEDCANIHYTTARGEEKLFMKLGTNIKKLRKERRLTLYDVATRTGFDVATISRIENGKMTGTIASHLAIAKVLDVNLPDLYEKAFNDDDEKKKAEISAFFSHSGGSVSEILIEQMFQKKMMPIKLTLKPKSETSEEQLPLGTERFLYVLQGKVTVVAKDESKIVSQDSSLYFNASTPHHYANTLSSKSICLVITTPMTL
ncbi:MAG: transcriptional regulator with XRE-family HTH domain [Candidatus Omnitrophota bacterium]|jgi:transcriptional regulator with XRE-family HTH domain